MSRQAASKRILPFMRTIGVLSAVGIITSFVTFSALQSSGNALTGNTIETATASLQISKDGNTYSDNVPGFDFNGVMPGGVAEPADNGGYMVALKNTGDTSLNLRLNVTGKPAVTGITDLSKVYVVVTRYIPGSGTFPSQEVPLSSLIAGQVNLTSLTAQAKGSALYLHMQVRMDADAVSGASGSISNLDLSFSGTPQ